MKTRAKMTTKICPLIKGFIFFLWFLRKIQKWIIWI